MVAATQLNRGYYGWRKGSLVETLFNDGTVLRFHPGLYPGSVAVMHLLAILRPRDRRMGSVYGEDSLPGRVRLAFRRPLGAGAGR